MAMPIISVPTFPNVPLAPGVPQLLRPLGAAINTVVLLAADAKALLSLFAGPRWGLYVGAKAILVGDSVVAVDVRQEYRISDYPLEDGGFASYDKVTTPLDLRVTLSVSGQASLLASLLGGVTSLLTLGGSRSQQETQRRNFLIAMKTQAASLQLIDVIVPEGGYGGLNIVHFDYRREGREGATLLRIDIWLQEVRRAPSGSFTTAPAATPPATPITAPKTPGAADPSATGSVQGAVPTPAQTGSGAAVAQAVPSSPGTVPGGVAAALPAGWSPNFSAGSPVYGGTTVNGAVVFGYHPVGVGG
jgi:hypothetical protein